MAFSGGFAGGFADAAAEPEPPAPTPVLGSPVWSPARPSRPATRRTGRATLRLKVSAVTWGAQGEHRSHHTSAASLLIAGEAAGRARTTMVGDLRTRYGLASAIVRTCLETHMGDPREDDPVVLLAVSALLLGRTP